MKKMLILVAFIFAVSLAVRAQGTITAPNGGESWVLGSTQEITWTHSGDNCRVKLQLYQGRTRLGVIDMGLHLHDDRYSWTVGRYSSDFMATTGSGYSIRMVNQDTSAEIDTSNASFTIASGSEPPPPAPVITVTSPAAGARVARASTLEVRWTHEGAMGERVQLRLFQAGADTVVREIIADTENDDSFDWPMPVALHAGSYRVNVKVLGEAVNGSGGVFDVIDKVRADPVVSEFRVVGPAAGEVIYMGTSATIIWDSPSAEALAMPCGAEVDIKAVRILKSGEVSIAKHVANREGRNRFSWTPASADFGRATGSYKIRIDSRNGCKAESGVFLIENRIPPTQENGLIDSLPLADLIGCDYAISSLTFADGRSLDDGVEVTPNAIIAEFSTQVLWNRRGPKPGTLSLQMFSSLTGQRLDKYFTPGAFSHEQANAAGMIQARATLSAPNRAQLLSMMRGRFLPVELRLIPSNPECDGLAGNNRREFDIRILNPLVPTDLRLEVEEDTIGVRWSGRQHRGKHEFLLTFWLNARNLTPNEAGGPGETVRNVRCSYKLTERDGSLFNILYDKAFVFDEVPYGSSRRMALTIPFELYPDNRNRLVCTVTLDPDQRSDDPNRDNNRASMVFQIPE